MRSVADLRGGVRALVRSRHFVPPPARLYEGGEEYLPGHASYATYNYLSGGPVARVKSAHFEAAFDLASPLFGDGAIDFGTADGVLLPSLVRRFTPVLAIDDLPEMVTAAQRVVDGLRLDATVRSNAGMSMEQLAAGIDRERYGVLFLLETLEHVGRADAMVQSRIEFLDSLFGLIRPGGTIILSVPNMVGLPFAVQRAALAATGALRDPISRSDLLRAVVLKDVSRLEPSWVRVSHLGFSHRSVERAMRSRLDVVGKRDLVFSKVYAVRRRGSAATGA
jgi:2-polyprenyl-3-methyl-5-hydroxy-6-metoxy-1,4-benzoquinol methylase